MMKLNLHKRLFNDTYYPLLFDYSHRWEVYRGSSGSGKSQFIAQKIIIKALNEQRRVLVCRDTGTTIKQTVFKLFEDTLKMFKIFEFCSINKTDRTITLPNGSEIIFTGLDSETKLLSLQNISDIFIEEVYEVKKDIVEQLNLRMRGKAPNQQIFMAFNPISAKHWLYDFCEINNPDSFLYTVTTYKDNRFLSDAYVKSLIDMKRTNPKKARVFVDGEWGVLIDDVVLPNHSIEEFNIQELLKNPKIEVRAGMDIGYIDPTAIVLSLYDKENKTIYIADSFYERGATLDEIAQAARDMGLHKKKIYCDSADPRAIAFFNQQGLRVEGAKKGKNSVKTGISFLQNHKIICHNKKECKNVAAELENYVYLRDKKTNQLIEDKTDHDYSHSIDALRYAYSDIYTQGLILMDKSIFSL